VEEDLRQALRGAAWELCSGGAVRAALIV
jgi:hypothetical protein